MPKKSYAKQKHKNEYVVKSKSAENAKSTESSQHTEEIEPDVDKEFIDVFQTSYNMLNESQPVYSHPRGRKRFTTLEMKLDKLFHEIINSTDMKLGNIAICASAYLNMSEMPFGITNVTQEFQLRESFIVKSLVLVYKHVLHRKMVLIAMKAYKALSYCRAILQDERRYKHFLQKAVNIYSSYTRNKDEFPAPFDPQIYLDIERDSRIVLEVLHIKILYTFGKILDTSSTQKEIDKCLKYVHIALQKHLTYMNSIKIDCENDSWIAQALVLVKKFAMNDRFIEAKHHLAAVCFVLDTVYGINMEIKDLPELLSPILQHNYLLLNMSFTVYLILLLNASRNRLLWNDGNKFYKTSSKPKSLTKYGKESKKLLLFSGIEEKAYISWVPDDYFFNYKRAKIFFVEILKCLNIAEKLYVDYKCDVEVELYIYKYISVAYAVLASYEQKENQIKLHKQRVNVLQNVLRKALISAMNIEIYKLIARQLGCIYAILLENQIDDFQLISQVNPKEVNEVNKLAISSLCFYESYLSEEMCSYYAKEM